MQKIICNLYVINSCSIGSITKCRCERAELNDIHGVQIIFYTPYNTGSVCLDL